jgi:hypothetical protein
VRARRIVAKVVLACALAGLGDPASAVTLLSHAKTLRLSGHSDPSASRGVLRVGRDPALAGAPDPSCPVASSFELGLFTVATNRIVRGPKVALDCAKWKRKGKKWVYEDPGAAGGVAKITYGEPGLTVRLTGPAVLPAAGPVGYVQAWFQVGSRRFHARFHSFKENGASRIVTPRPSKDAARGEAGFWAALWGDAGSEADQQATLDALAAAARRSRKDARSRFLTGMLRLYRFGQRTTSFSDADAAAQAEIEAAVAAFDEAEPLLWDRASGVGDSRVPGFAAAARYALAVVTGDEPLRQQALEDLAYAIDINGFFNVFDLITVAQAEAPGSAAFQMAFAAMDAYLSNPETLSCLLSQPEICSNAGLAPAGLIGAVVLFGDLNAKAGNQAQASVWYQLAAGAENGWAFEGLAADRLATVAARVAAYGDADPGNDPPIIGAGAEACASCHLRPVATP